MMRFYLLLPFIALVLVKTSLKAQQAKRFDIVITEIMADPSPPKGLPNAEYIEIRNRSSLPLSLNGWKIGDASSSGTISSNFILQPDSLVILCANSQVIHFSAFGKTIGVSNMPSLDNEGDLISLRSFHGKTIHAVEYSSSWFPNSLKQEGGWSLEMIDPGIPCAGKSNWAASVDDKGGSPGQVNSVNGHSTDQDPPQLLRTYTKDSLNIIAVFDEPMDSASASDISRYSILENMNIIHAEALPPLFMEVAITLAMPMQKRKIYSLKAVNITDCMNNPVGAFNLAYAGLPEPPGAADVVINEILFNPLPNCFDFVELYNTSDKIIDASGIFIANRNSQGEIASAKKIIESKFNIYPGEYLSLTENKTSLQSCFLVKKPVNILQLNSLPSYPDQDGTVVITNDQGMVLEEVTYSEKWHFGLISDGEGVSIERIDPLQPASNPGNWHSASSTSGYATPGYKNSQWRGALAQTSALEVYPAVFSPDNDGHEDLAFINYKMEQPGFVANIVIFDMMGRNVRILVKNDLMGIAGKWTWDGLDEKRRSLPIGHYIIFVELFDLTGKKYLHKIPVVLARKIY